MLFDESIYHTGSYDPSGIADERHAVRAIILRDGLILMVLSADIGDYKFAGGGIETGESHEEALVREIREETGYCSAHILAPAGKTREYRASRKPGFGVYIMTSHYYYVEISGEPGPLSLDEYEKELGFTAHWISLETALRENRSLLCKPELGQPAWLEREIRVLEILAGGTGV